jgi:hypothetical protein
MALAALFNVPTSEDQLANWSFAHMAHHRDIIRVIYERTGVALPEYALDPVDVNAGGSAFNWERLHQQMHAQMDLVLGIAPYNLLGVDWKNENRLAAWVLLNASEHRQAGDILGLG